MAAEVMANQTSVRLPKPSAPSGRRWAASSAKSSPKASGSARNRASATAVNAKAVGVGAHRLAQAPYSRPPTPMPSRATARIMPKL